MSNSETITREAAIERVFTGGDHIPSMDRLRNQAENIIRKYVVYAIWKFDG